MMTFDELVNHTYAHLAERNQPVQLEKIRDILGETGIVGLMLCSSTDTSRRLLIRQIWLKGRKWQPEMNDLSTFEYRRILQPGLNGWVAGNDTGKSTILKSIIWALTGVRPTFKSDVLSWLEDVAVEIEIVDSGIHTIRYFPRPGQPDVTGSIFALGLDATLSGSVPEPVESFSGRRAMSEAIGRFFCSKMGFSPLEWARWKPYSIQLTRQTVSWDVYSQALFIGADDYSDYLFHERSINGKHHQRTLGMYLGLDLLEAVSKAQMERDQLRQKYEFERQRVKTNAAQVAGRLEQLKAELHQVEDRLQRIDAEQTVLIDPVYAQQVRDRVAACTDKIVALSNRQRECQQEEQRVQTELNQAERACQTLRESIEFRLFLSGLTVERCPRCENPISQIRVEEELETRLCRVCRSELRPITAVDDYEALLNAAQDKVAETKTDLRRIRRELKQVSGELDGAQQELESHRAEFNDLSRREREGFTSELRSLLDRQGYLRGQLEQLQEQTEESQAERLRDLQQRRDVLRAAHLQLQAGITLQHRAVFEMLESRTAEMAAGFGVRNLERVFFKAFDMFAVQSGKSIRFQDMDSGEALRLKIAFHLTLLTLRVSEELGRHPSLLIIDAPASAEMDEQHFGAILEGFRDVVSQLGDQLQILIATTKDDLIDVCGRDRVDYRPHGETFF
jgi:predicted nuclease with TOPRIM domain